MISLDQGPQDFFALLYSTEQSLDSSAVTCVILMLYLFCLKHRFINCSDAVLYRNPVEFLYVSVLKKMCIESHRLGLVCQETIF